MSSNASFDFITAAPTATVTVDRSHENQIENSDLPARSSLKRRVIVSDEEADITDLNDDSQTKRSKLNTDS